MKNTEELNLKIYDKLKYDNFFYIPFKIDGSILNFEIRANFNINPSEIELNYYDALNYKHTFYFKDFNSVYNKINELIKIY